MVYRYNSPLCRNCRRDKRLAAPGLDTEPGWLAFPHCYDCAARRCPEWLESGTQCTECEAVAKPGDHPAAYLGYCRRHHTAILVCSRRGCRNPKEPHARLCDSCQEGAAIEQRRALVRDWRREGTICPDCRQALQHAPQQWCEACLVKRGIAPLEPPEALLRALHATAQAWGPTPAGVALDPKRVVRVPYCRQKRYKPKYWTRRVRRRRDGTPAV